MARASFVISIIALVIAAGTFALVITGMMRKRVNYFSAD
jgi:hypothetical protein